MNVKLFQDADKDVWDSFIRESENGTIFHTWDWLKIVERHSVKKVSGKRYPSKLYPLGVFDNSQLIGVFPIFFYDVPFFGFVASPPLAVENYYLGPATRRTPGSSSERYQIHVLEFFREIDAYIKETINPRFILIHTAPGIIDMRPLKWLGYNVEPRYTYRIDLTLGKEMLWKMFPRSLKRYINKANEAGIVIREGNKDDLRHIYNLLKNRSRIYPDFNFLEDLFERYYPDNLRIFIAYHGEERLSGIISLTYDKTAYFWIGSPKYLFHGFSPNEAVLWDSICWAIDNGYSQFEIMGADDASLFPFKRKFNATISLYFTARWLSPFMKVIESIYHIAKPRY